MQPSNEALPEVTTCRERAAFVESYYSTVNFAVAVPVTEPETPVNVMV